MTARRASARSPAYMAAADHRRLWRMVEGAVVDAFIAHPDYLTAKGRHAAVESITKRVVGLLVGHAKQTREGGRAPGTGGGCRVEAEARGGTAHLPVHSGQGGRGSPNPPATSRKWRPVTRLPTWACAAPAGGYALIMADPPWQSDVWSEGGLGRAPEAKYATMATAEIAALPIEAVAARDCLLWLWARPCMMPDAYAVMRGWGFAPKTMGFWVKLTPHGKLCFGLGKLLRDAGEPFLIGTIGAPKTARDVRGVIHAPRREHSRKPDAAYAAAEQLMPGVRRLDLFARQRRPGWDAFGNEVERFG